MPISKDLLATIVDEVFGGSIEDTQVIEDIHRVIMRELFVTPRQNCVPYPHARLFPDGIIITISNDQLKFGTENSEEFWDGESGANVPNVTISNLEGWKVDVRNELNKEGETGNTPLTNLIDECIREALEYGSDNAEPTSDKFK